MMETTGMPRIASVILLAAGALQAQTDFATQIHPLFAARCAGCHAGAAAQAGLRVDDRESVTKVKDKLLPKVRGQAGFRMPPSGPPLTPREIAMLERWVGDGMPWTGVKAVAGGPTRG